MSSNPKKHLFRLFFVTSILVGIIVFAHSSCFALMAGTGHRLVTNQYKRVVYALGISATLLNGEGKEYVYDPELDGMKVSDLRWESDNVLLVGGELTMQYGSALTLNAGWWRKLSAKTGTMTDDDWNAIEGLWESNDPRFQTNFSESKSDLTEGSVYDINGSLSVIRLMRDDLHVRALLGYKKEKWEWEASDGYWIYIEELVENLGEEIVGVGTAGNIDGVGIRYKQKMTIPYIGVSIDYRGRGIGLEAHALYSNRVEIKATDDHLERNLRTEDSFSDGEYWSLGLNHKWYINPKLSLVGSIEHEKIQTIKGDSKWIFYDEDIQEVVEDGAGAGYHATTVTFSVVYVF